MRFYLLLFLLLASCAPYPADPDSMIAQGLAGRTATARADQIIAQSTAAARQETKSVQEAIAFDLSVKSTEQALSDRSTQVSLSVQSTTAALDSIKATQIQAATLDNARRKAEKAALDAQQKEAATRAKWDTFWQATLKILAFGLAIALVVLAIAGAVARVLVYLELNSIKVENDLVIIPRHEGRVRYNLVAHLEQPIDIRPRLVSNNPIAVTDPSMSEERKEVLRFLARAIRKVGPDSNQIPSDDVMGCKTHEWKAVIGWLKDADAAYTIPSSGTFVMEEIGNLSDLFMGVEEGAISPSPSPLPGGWIRTQHARTHGHARSRS